MSEPMYIRQTSDREHLADAEAWFKDATEGGKGEGATHFRASLHTNPEALLMEGWVKAPLDEGPQRWAFRQG